MTQQPNPVYPEYPDATRPMGNPSDATPPPAPRAWATTPNDAGTATPPPASGWPGAPGPAGHGNAMTPQQEKNWGMLAHLIPAGLFVLSAGTLGFFASLAVYLMYKDRGPFVRAHAANSLNLQIVTGIGLIVSAVLMFVLIGFITYPIICIWAVVMHLIGASKASSGQWYDPPLVPKFLR